MSKRVTFAFLLMAVLFVDVRCQFYDFFEGLQPHQSNRHTQKRTNATRRVSNQRFKQISDTTRKYDIDVPFFVFGEGFDRDSRHRAKPTRNNIHNVHATTRASVKKSIKNSSHRATSNTNSKNERLVTNNANVYGEYDNYGRDHTQSYIDGSINFIEYTTRKTTTKRDIQNNYDSNSNNVIYKQKYQGSGNINGPDTNNYWTTQNPFKSGVRTGSVDSLQPITNRPVTRRPSFIGRDTDNTDIEPEVRMGVDVDETMSYAEKKSYIEIAEKMCDKYKSLSMKQLQAIPLVPSPQPVRINVSSCAPTTIPLIVGGKVVTIQEFPHMAMLGWTKLKDDGYSWKCGGSLVSNQHVITAAHCTYYERDNTVVAGSPRAVQLGSSYRDDPNALIVKISSITKHPRYKSPISYYDIAIVKLVTTVRFSDAIKPACLGVPPPIGKSIIATGWGQTQYGGDQSKELRSVSLPLWNMDECRNVLGVSRRIPDGPSRDSQICAGERSGGKDTCQGDSGGPAQIQDGCIWRIVGVTSLGRACGAAYTPGIYSIVNRAFIAAEIFGSNVGNNNNNGNDDNTDNYGDRISTRRDSNENIEKRNNNHKTTTDNNYSSRRSGGNNKNYKNSDINDYNNRQGGVNYDTNYNNNNNRRTVTERNNNYDNVNVNSNYDSLNYYRTTENNNNQAINYNSQRSDIGKNQFDSTNGNYDSNYNDQRKNSNDNSRTVTERNNNYENINNGYNVNNDYNNNDYYNNRQNNNYYNNNDYYNNRQNNNYYNRQQQNSYNSNNNNGPYNWGGVYWTR